MGSLLPVSAVQNVSKELVALDMARPFLHGSARQHLSVLHLRVVHYPESTRKYFGLNP
jgi:hypothetical protein